MSNGFNRKQRMRKANSICIVTRLLLPIAWFLESAQQTRNKTTRDNETQIKRQKQQQIKASGRRRPILSSTSSAGNLIWLNRLGEGKLPEGASPAQWSQLPSPSAQQPAQQQIHRPTHNRLHITRIILSQTERNRLQLVYHCFVVWIFERNGGVLSETRGSGEESERTGGTGRNANLDGCLI